MAQRTRNRTLPPRINRGDTSIRAAPLGPAFWRRQSSTEWSLDKPDVCQRADAQLGRFWAATNGMHKHGRPLAKRPLSAFVDPVLPDLRKVCPATPDGGPWRIGRTRVTRGGARLPTWTMVSSRMRSTELPLFSLGTSDEIAGSPQLAHDDFAIRFEGEIFGLVLHNQDPLRVVATIDRLPPIGNVFELSGPPLPLLKQTGEPSRFQITSVTYTPLDPDALIPGAFDPLINGNVGSFVSALSESRRIW